MPPGGGYRFTVSEAPPTAVVVRTIDAAETRPLRMAVLRPGQPPETAVFPGDGDERTRHFGAFAGGRLVGIASVYAESRAGKPPGGWRLRGMATDPSARGQGAGRAVLAASVDYVAAEGGGELWANARIAALEFYTRAGFEVVSERFEIPGIGGHFVVRRLVEPAPPLP